MRRRLARLAGEERGFTLVLTLGVLIVTSVMIVSITEYSSATSRGSTKSKADQIAYSLAETGVNNAMSILANPSNNALQQSTLPSAEASASSASYEGGTAKWWGIFNVSTSVWTIYGKGIVANPTGPGSAAVTRTLSATSQVVANYSQPLNATAWNFVYSTKTGDPDGCDMVVKNSAVLTTPLYVMGNLCLQNTAAVDQGAEQPVSVVVKGRLVLDSSSNRVGTAAAPISSLQTGNGCKLGNNAVHSPCTSADNVWATTIGTTPPPADPAAADFNFWYVNASLGPNAPCETQTGTPPPLADPNGLRDGSLNEFELTPSSSYSCQRGAALISWNAATRHLTVQGAIYIDGAVKISNNAVNTYSGQGSLYLSKGFTISGTAQLCGAVVSGNCDFNTWDPNQNLLMFVADGIGGNSATMQNSAWIQAGIYGTTGVDLQNTAQLEGPIVASEILFQNSAQMRSFPPIDTVPAGTPGNPNIYAEPQKPQNYSG